MEKKDRYFLVGVVVLTDQTHFPLMVGYRDPNFVNMDKLIRQVDGQWKDFQFGKFLKFQGLTVTSILEVTKFQQDYFFAQPKIIQPEANKLITESI